MLVLLRVKTSHLFFFASIAFLLTLLKVSPALSPPHSLPNFLSATFYGLLTLSASFCYC